jgi:AcrR family transcriptional regulator
MTPAAPTRSQRSDARANREALLTAAIELFGRCGPNAPYEDVAEAAGVGRATLYRHFPTREDLLVAIFDGTLDRLELLAETFEPGPGRFGRLFDACVLEQKRNLPLLELATRSTPPRERARLRRRFAALFGEPLREAQAAGVATHGTSAEDVRLVLMMLSALLGPASAAGDTERAIELARSLLLSS